MASKAKAPKKGAAVPKGPVPGTIVGEANGLPIRRLRVDEIDAAHYNPREISERALEGLAGSVQAFGLVQPLVWNLRFRRLVGGHQRLKTLSGDTDVVQVDLDEIEEKALNTELNNKAIQGDFTAAVGEILDDIESKRPELFSKLALEDLRVDVPELPGEPPAPDEFPTVDEDPPAGHTCPKCGHSWD